MYAISPVSLWKYTEFYYLYINTWNLCKSRWNTLYTAKVLFIFVTRKSSLTQNWINQLKFRRHVYRISLIHIRIHDSALHETTETSWTFWTVKRTVLQNSIYTADRRFTDTLNVERTLQDYFLMNIFWILSVYIIVMRWCTV